MCKVLEDLSENTESQEKHEELDGTTPSFAVFGWGLLLGQAIFAGSFVLFKIL